MFLFRMPRLFFRNLPRSLNKPDVERYLKDLHNLYFTNFDAPCVFDQIGFNPPAANEITPIVPLTHEFLRETIDRHNVSIGGMINNRTT